MANKLNICILIGTLSVPNTFKRLKHLCRYVVSFLILFYFVNNFFRGMEKWKQKMLRDYQLFYLSIGYT